MPNDAEYLVPAVEQELCQEGPVLPGGTCDQGPHLVPFALPHYVTTASPLPIVTCAEGCSQATTARDIAMLPLRPAFTASGCPTVTSMETSAVSVRARTFALPILDRLPSIGVWLLGFLFVSFVAGSAGGFRPTTWAWTALLSWWIAVIALIGKRRLALGFLDLTTIAGILAFTGWFALSAVWSQSVPSTLDATIRFVAYAGLVVAALLVVERTTVPHLVGGVTAGIGILALYALGTRVLPDRLGNFSSTSVDTYRLSVPITYWNGLGVFCAIGAPAGARVRDSGRAVADESDRSRRPAGARMLHVLHLQSRSVAFAVDRVCGCCRSRPATIAARFRHDRGRRTHGSCDRRRLAHGRPDETGHLARRRRRTTGTASCLCCSSWSRSRLRRLSRWRFVDRRIDVPRSVRWRGRALSSPHS